MNGSWENVWPMRKEQKSTQRNYRAMLSQQQYQQQQQIRKTA